MLDRDGPDVSRASSLRSLLGDIYHRRAMIITLGNVEAPAWRSCIAVRERELQLQNGPFLAFRWDPIAIELPFELNRTGNALAHDLVYQNRVNGVSTLDSGAPTTKLSSYGR